jgi:hypothetical protein
MRTTRAWLRLIFQRRLPRGKYSALLGALIVLPLLQALVDGHPLLELTYWLGFVAMLVCAMVAVGRSRQAFWTGIALGFPTFTALLLVPTTGFNVDHHFQALVLVRTAVFLTLLAALGREILRDVLHARCVMFDQVCGGLCVYLMIGFAWGIVYVALVRMRPGAFAIDWDRFGLTAECSPTRLNGVMTYFSFVCLTTLGFGDISPVTPLARALVGMEAVLSQLYMAVFVARLVSQYLASGAVTVTVDQTAAHPPVPPPPHLNRGRAGGEHRGIRDDSGAREDAGAHRAARP